MTITDTVVHVPLIGRIGGIGKLLPRSHVACLLFLLHTVGVIEICGLFIDGLTSYKSCERDNSLLRAMMQDPHGKHK